MQNESVLLDKSALKFLCNRADELIDVGCSTELNNFVSAVITQTYTFDSSIDEAQYHYMIGNCCDKLFNIHNSEWYSPNLDRAKISFSKALNKLKSVDIDPDTLFLKSCILTNLANVLSTQGRIFEAISYYDEAIALCNPVAILGKARNQLSIAMSVYDHVHQMRHYKKTYWLSKEFEAQKEQVHEQIRKAIEPGSQLFDFMQWYEDNLKDLEIDLAPYELTGESRKEIKYYEWCGENVSCLNDLNDGSGDPESYSDYLGMPGVSRKANTILTDEEELAYHYHFDEIKSEYCYARYLLFSSLNIPSNSSHFFNNTFSKVDCNSYPLYNLKVNNYKSAFRTLYSLLDKIAFFVHRLFDLKDIDKDKHVSFESIFKRGGRSIEFKPSPKVSELNNMFLHALFFILKDIRDVSYDIDKENSVRFWNDPDSESFVDIRNALEHRSLKICGDNDTYITGCDSNFYEQQTSELKEEKQRLEKEFDNIGKNDSTTSNDQKTKKARIAKRVDAIDRMFAEKRKLNSHSLAIKVPEMEVQTLKLLKLVRSSIMYLSLAIYAHVREIDNESPCLRREVPRKQG